MSGIPFLPSTSIGEVLHAMGRIIRFVPKYLKERKKKAMLNAWQETSFATVCEALNIYYEKREFPLFSYPAASDRFVKVPLYVRPEWTRLSLESLNKSWDKENRQFSPTKAQKNFIQFYQELRKILGLGLIWPGEIFRLTSMSTSSNKLILKFEMGSFLDATMSQYILEHELVTAITKEKYLGDLRLPLRDTSAGTISAVETFCQKNVVRIGVSNLLLLRCEDDKYAPIVQKRGKQSMGMKGKYDTVSSGIFDIIGFAEQDFELEHKVLTEIYEELFDKKEVARKHSRINPTFFYEENGIRELRRYLKNGLASFDVTGFCIDLIRIVPEITTVLIVRDERYYKEYINKFKLNPEYEKIRQFFVPRYIGNINEYFSNHIPTDPVDHGAGYGFDPIRWTLPGAFCFYQGLKKAVDDKLL